MRTLPLFGILSIGLLSSIPCHAADGSILVQLAYNPGNLDKPFIITWSSVAGGSYDVLATEDLDQPWTKLNAVSIIANSSSTSFTDPLILGRRFYQILQHVPGQEPALSSATMTPSHAALAPNGTQQFKATLPLNASAVWSVHSFGSDRVGTVDASGLYTAPNVLPDPPFILVRAQPASDPSQAAIAMVHLVPKEDLVITREQAIEILLRDVISTFPGKTNLVALGLHEPLDSNARIRPADPFPGATTTQVRINDLCWFFMIDQDPLSNWMHPVRYVQINAHSGAVDGNTGQVWYPELNGEAIWSSSTEVLTERDRVYIGSAVAAQIPATTTTAAPLKITTHSLQSAGGDFVEIRRVFSPAQTACVIPPPVRRYAVLSVLSPQESRLIASVRRWKEVFESNGFSTKTFEQGTAADLYLELDRLRSVVRPSDVLVVFLLGHGIGGSIVNTQSGVISDQLLLIPTSGKYLIMEACDAGYIFEIFKNHSVTPRVHILTASNKADPDSFIQITGTSPLFLLGDSKSVFSSALLSCLFKYDTLAEVHACLTQFSELGGVGLRLKLADPQLETVGDDDTDEDGVPDKLEIELGLDPLNADTDGDGVCDGIEFGQLANLEKLTAEGLRDINYSRGGRRPRFSTNPTLPDALVATAYQQILTITQGVPYTTGSAGPLNPFGAGPNARWALTQGSLPPGLTLDAVLGRVSGTATAPGTFSFELTYMDAIGVRAKQSFRLNALNRGTAKPEITVTTTSDGNVRDDDLSLREAIMLATGKLKLSDLRPDPNPNDGKSEGEVRWVQNGLPGASSEDVIKISISGSDDLVVTAPISLDADGDDIQIGTTHRLFATVGPVFQIPGNRNNFSTSFRCSVNSGPAFVVTGNFNQFSRSAQLATRALSIFEGGGNGDGFLISGNNNVVNGLVIRGFGNGVHLTGGATENLIFRTRLVGNQNGGLLDGGASGNTLRELAVGFLFEDVVPPSAIPNAVHGIVITDGATLNHIVDSGVGANGGSGILIQGSATRQNEILTTRVGSAQGTFSTSGEAGPNGQNGIVITGGAHENRVAGGDISANNGHGILISGSGTDLNEIGSNDMTGLLINKPDASGDGIRIEDTAARNVVSVQVQQCGGAGISFVGSGTLSNRVSHRLFSAIYFPTLVQKTTGPGISVRGGASRNLIQSALIQSCSTGISISEPGSNENLITGATLRSNLVSGLRIENGAQLNRVEGNSTIDANKTGLILTGEGTRLNHVQNCTLGFSVANEQYGVELRNGAQENIVTVNIQRQKLGGILLDGALTSLNRIENGSVTGGTEPSEVSGHGVTLQNGAQSNLIIGNLFSGNGGHGLLIIDATTSSNRVVANRFTSNQLTGVRIENARANVIGSPSGAGNFFNGHPAVALHITGAQASQNQVLGNQIGGSVASLKNGSHGILIDGGANNNTVGGPIPQSRDPHTPQILLLPLPSNRGAGNWILGNGGDGIRIAGANTNRILGNLIGYSQPEEVNSGNAGHGIAIIEGARENRIGNTVSREQRNPGYGNQIVHNRGAGVFISGAQSTGNRILQNRIQGNAQPQIVLESLANGNIQAPIVSINVPAAQITGNSAAPGYIELYSSTATDPVVYHLTAFVGRGEFLIDQLNPNRSVNGSIIESDRPIRYGLQQCNITDLQSGNTSAFDLSNLPPPG